MHSYKKRRTSAAAGASPTSSCAVTRRLRMSCCGHSVQLVWLCRPIRWAFSSQHFDSLEPGQQLALVSLDDQPRVLAAPTSDALRLKGALQTLQPTTRQTNLQAALSIAGSLAEDHADAQVVIISDGGIDRGQI